MPNARTLSAVAWPTQAIFTPENARASRPNSLNFSHTARTALVEVKTTHWNRPSTRPLTARSICAGLRGGSTAMVGTSIGRAPWADQLFAHLAGLVLGARHQHGPAVQRAALPPVQLRAVGDGLADGHHQRPGQRAGRRLSPRAGRARPCRAGRPASSPPNAAGTWCRSRSPRPVWRRPGRTRSACGRRRADATRWRAGSADPARRPARPSPRRRERRRRCAPSPAADPRRWAPRWCRADPARSRSSGGSSPGR